MALRPRRGGDHDFLPHPGRNRPSAGRLPQALSGTDGNGHRRPGSPRETQRQEAARSEAASSTPELTDRRALLASQRVSQRPLRRALRKALRCPDCRSLCLRAPPSGHARDPGRHTALGPHPGADFRMPVLLSRSQSRSTLPRRTALQHAVRNRTGCRHRPLAARASVVSLRGTPLQGPAHPERPGRNRRLCPRRGPSQTVDRTHRRSGKGRETADGRRAVSDLSTLE